MVISVKTSVGSYNIRLERGILKKAGEVLNLCRRVLIVTDSGVPEEYSKTVAASCETPFIYTLPEGEESKCLENYAALLKFMVENNFTRSDCVVAVGGGVVGDLSGFVAATYMRGVDFYNIPTTVLSQIDSSIGGKTAIDFSGYKNIVGAFYPPKCVLIDPDTLKTLPPRQISNGLSEAVKMALTCDAELFEIFEKDDIPTSLERIIERSLYIKKRVVEEDEREGGLRRVLNFGHTLAHAVESADNMQNLYHGECVAIGMLPMCSAAVRERLEPVLNKLSLPTKTEFSADTLIEAARHDKKLSGDKITVVYVSEIGKFELKKIPFSEYSQLIRQVQKI